jgi:ABC-type phosphate transport system substrate-binding protein
MRLRTLVALLVLAMAGAAPAADAYVIVIHPSVPGASVRRSDLAAVFLRKATRWGDGSLAVPVDQSGTSTVRSAFSQAVLQMPVTAVVQYWQKQMFTGSGLRPPAVRGSDAEVIAFVAKTKGAVGYVSPGTALPPDVKALAVIE